MSADLLVTNARLVTPSGVVHAALAVRDGRIAALALPGATPLQGGIPILFEGKVIGAIGVSGETPSQDEEIAKTGAEAAKSLGAK